MEIAEKVLLECAMRNTESRAHFTAIWFKRTRVGFLSLCSAEAKLVLDGRED